MPKSSKSLTSKADGTSLRKVENLPGFVTNFLLCGPFNSDGSLTSCQALDKDYLSVSGDESACQPRAGLEEHDSGGNKVGWTPYAVRYGFVVNLVEQFGGKAIVCYAAAYLFCPQKTKAHVFVGSDDGFKLYVNGKMVGQNHIHRGLGVDCDQMDVEFRMGVNLLLMKVEQNFGAYEFCLRITDSRGKAIKGMRALFDHPDSDTPVNPARQRTVSSYDYLSYKFATANPELSYKAKNQAEHTAWKRQFLRKYTSLLGAPLPSCSLRPEVTDESIIGNCHRRSVLLDFEPGFSIPCFLTEPVDRKKGEKLPAVLCLHGHGRGKADMLGLNLGTPDEAPWSKAYAMALHASARRYITISPDFLAFGERLGQGAAYGNGQDACSAQFSWAQAVGLVPTAVNIHTVRRCIDYLETLSYVDNNRIGVMGHSFGCYMTVMASAVEPRLKTIVASGFVCSMAGYHGKTWTCGSQVVPGLFNYGDIADVACLIAPRPMLAITGLQDCVTPAPFALAAFNKIKKAYAACDAKEKVEQFLFDGEHLFQPEAALNWLDKWL